MIWAMPIIGKLSMVNGITLPAAMGRSAHDRTRRDMLMPRKPWHSSFPCRWLPMTGRRRQSRRAARRERRRRCIYEKQAAACVCYRRSSRQCLFVVTRKRLPANGYLCATASVRATAFGIRGTRSLLNSQYMKSQSALAAGQIRVDDGTKAVKASTLGI